MQKPQLSMKHFRLDLHTFALDQFKNFWIFGYGTGAFEQLFKNFYIYLMWFFS